MDIINAYFIYFQVNQHSLFFGQSGGQDPGMYHLRASSVEPNWVHKKMNWASCCELPPVYC